MRLLHIPCQDVLSLCAFKTIDSDLVLGPLERVEESFARV